MYSPDIEKICALCVHASFEKGINTHVSCSVKGGFMPCSKTGCDSFIYDIFKKKVRRKKAFSPGGYSPEDFKL